MKTKVIRKSDGEILGRVISPFEFTNSKYRSWMTGLQSRGFLFYKARDGNLQMTRKRLCEVVIK